MMNMLLRLSVSSVIGSVSSRPMNGTSRVIAAATHTVAGAALPHWFPNPLHDQHLSGDFLWFLAEIADLPVIIALFTRWSRVDKKDAKKIDDLSDEEYEAAVRAHLGQRG